MIDLGSPIDTVLGDRSVKRKKIVDNLGLRTVGDLLRHFPRRYVRTGELTRLDELEEGQVLVVVGEISASDLRTYREKRTGRPAFRLETLLRADGASLQMSFFAKNRGMAAHLEKRLPRGRRGDLPGQGVALPQPVAADQPPDGALRQRRGGPRGAHARDRRRALPDLPPHQGRGVLGHPARRRLRPHRPRRAPRAPARGRARRARPPRRHPGLLVGPPPRQRGAGAPGPAPLPVRGGPGHPAGAGAPSPRRARPRGPPADRPTRRRPGPAGRLRRAAALRAHRPASARSAPRSTPTWRAPTR